MNLIAEVRGRGGKLALTAAGGLDVQNVAASLIPKLKAERDTVIRTLKSEALDGIRYCDSGPYFCIDHMFDAWSYQCDSEEKQQALTLIFKWDDAMQHDLYKGAKLVLDEWPLMAALIENRPMAGAMLAKAAAAEARKASVNSGVLDDAPVTAVKPVTPAPQPRQTDMTSLIDPPFSAPTVSGVNASVLD